jgi:hypothetical protein
MEQPPQREKQLRLQLFRMFGFEDVRVTHSSFRRGENLRLLQKGMKTKGGAIPLFHYTLIL